MLEQLSSIGYWIATAGFACLFLLLIPTYNSNSSRKKLLLLTCLSGCIWAVISSSKIFYNYSVLPSLMAESLFNFVITLLLITMITGSAGLANLFKHRLYWLSGVISIIGALELSHFLYPLLDQTTFFFLHLIQATIGLWLIESLYRHNHPENTYEAIRPLCLGLGLIFGYNFAFYADAFLTNTLASPYWQARGWLITISIPFIALATRRIQSGGSNVYISRDVVFHSTLSLAAGFYLLIMAMTSYYIKSIGSEWADIAQMLFFSFSGLILVGLFFSEPLRKQLKVFITKHFYANKYEYRKEWMSFYSTMENNKCSPYERALTAMLEPFGCNHGVLILRQHGVLVTVANINCPAEHAHITVLIDLLAEPSMDKLWISEINKLATGEESPPYLINHKKIPNPCHFSLMVPLTSSDDLQGLFLLAKPTSTDQVNWEDRDLMKAISSQISVYLAMHETNKKLAITQQFDTFNKMSSFLVHDLKNVLTQLQLLNQNALQHKHNPEFIDDAFETVDFASQRLESVLSQLKNKRIEHENIHWFELTSVITEACTLRAAQQPKPNFTPNDLLYLKANKERVKNVFNHLLQNAQDATPPDGKVHISLQIEGKHCSITISDTGHGMSNAFINTRLFQPFDSTKGNAGMGLGAYDAKLLFEQLNGSIQVQSTINKGTRFIISFPLSQLNIQNCSANEY
ncbi:XrtA/PEP-CTERM system histidine kinase PrsK [Photobacterium nomapromontoriensis]|uniref:XrtA/PEP-CTERM system histidine kinase PrsK n=1 Tax=Photobacterium nomapromontoriensis TaxID=2910237 RepID=UPI003D12B8CC